MRLIQGDCLQAMDNLIAKGVKVDAIITDPPYGTTACKWDSVIPFDDMWPRLKALRKERTPVVLFGSEPFSSALRMSNIKEFKYDWIWDKKFAGNFAVSKYQPLKVHEHICVFGKGRVDYYSQKIIREKPIKAGGNKCKSESSPIKYAKKEYEGKLYKYKMPVTILNYSVRNGGRGLHPTQKPVALLEYLVKTYTQEGDTVLDFTMGSGTTGVACKNLGRDFIGIELDESYYNIAKERIENTVVQGELV